MTLRAVVFDCDGVLVDSEPHSRAAWLAVLGPMGHPATAADVAACTGLGFLPTHAHLAALGPIPPPAEVWPLLMSALRASFETGLRRFDDAVDAVQDLALAGVLLAVASSSPRERLAATLEHAGLTGRFEVTIAGDEVASGKPAPDVYVAAAAGLGVEAVACLAVEDSGPGAAAAVAAGMKVVGVARQPGVAAELIAAGAAVVDAIDTAVIMAMLS